MSSLNESSETQQLLDRIQGGDRAALEELVDAHRTYLKRLLALRMEGELLCRVDPSDVVQETQLAVSERIDDYLDRRGASFRVWLRRTALERLVDVRRKHLAARRSIRRETRLSDASSFAIARHLLGQGPSQILQRKEQARVVREAIDQLNEFDREILLLRYVEELSNAEVAELLEIEPAAARKRHGRAIRRLSEQLARHIGSDPQF